MTEQAERIRYSADEVKRNAYYQMPKFLFTSEFKELSNDARVLYSLLRDRHDLSIKNNWIDDKGKVYLIFTRDAMCDMLALSDKTVTKAITALKKFKLLEEERLGQGKPNKIYLLTVAALENTKTRSFYDSRTGEIPVLEPENFRPNKTDINKTDSNKQQTPQTNVVVVSTPALKSLHKPKTAPDVSCLSFIAELPDRDKLSILKAADNDVESIRAAYDMAKQQGGIDSLTAWIITMAGKLQNGEASQQVKVSRQTVNRFVNFEQRKIDFKELERLELEQLKAGMRKDDEQEEFGNIPANAGRP